MSEKFFVGRDIVTFSDNGEYKPVSKVTLIVDSEHSFSAGDNTGLEIVAECPYATQAMADELLSKFSGYVYHAYEAGDANIDPAAELGDGVAVNGVYGVIANIRDDGMGYPTISAPGQAELEEEFPYTSTTQKVINQTEALRSETKVLIDRVNGITVTGPDGTTKVKGGSIETDTLNVKAANVSGELAAASLSLNGELILDTPASIGPTALGYVGATASLGDTQGVALMSLLKENYVIATATGAKLVSNSSGTHVELACFGVPMSGNYGISASHTINVTSDKRLKNSISYDMEKYEPFFGRIRPCIFRMNNGGDKYHMGFIAQDLLEASNAAGLENGDLSLVNEVGDHYAVGYTEMISLNTHMIQKLTARVAELEEKISNLEAILNG